MRLYLASMNHTKLNICLLAFCASTFALEQGDKRNTITESQSLECDFGKDYMHECDFEGLSLHNDPSTKLNSPSNYGKSFSFYMISKIFNLHMLVRV